MPITAHREIEMDDEHSPYWKPEDHASLVDFLSAVARGALFAAAIAMFLTLLGCDDYERRVRIQEWKDRFVNGCMPRKGDTVTAQWVDGNLICKRITPSPRYGATFPHAEVKVAEIGDME
jgi:hypothetical protein